MARYSLLFLLLAVASATSRAQGVITTVAGTTWIFRGDGGPALDAPLDGVWGLVLDAEGQIIAADPQNHIVVNILRNGTLRVVAGNGIPGFSGDGGAATSAAINAPTSVALDPGGNLYIADTFNNRIRKVSPEGTITTIAGSGPAGFAGDGGPAVLALLNGPNGVAADSAGNVYVADTLNHRIRKVDRNGTITTIAGTGAATFSGEGGPATAASFNRPFSVAVGPDGNLYIGDGFNSRVRKIDQAGIIRTAVGNGLCCFAGDGGAATSARINEPYGLSFDRIGNLYIADLFSRIRKVDVNGVISSVAGGGSGDSIGDGGPATSAILRSPRGVAVATDGTIYIADTNNQRIRVVAPEGTISTFAGNGLFRDTGDGGPATSATLDFVVSPLPGFSSTIPGGGVVSDATGALYIADNGNQRVRKVSNTGVITTIAGGSSIGAVGVGVDGAGNVYVSSGDRIIRIASDGTRSTVAGGGTANPGDGGPATGASLVQARGIAVDAQGNIYVAETLNHRIRLVTTAGVITTVAGTGTQGFAGDAGPATSAALSSPHAVALDSAGTLFVADTGNNRIRKILRSGTISTVAGGGSAGDGVPATSAALNSPLGVAIDSQNNIYIAETAAHRIRKVNASGTITTVAGTGVAGFSGDGGPATSASLQRPRTVAVDAAGNLYIVDSDNHRIRKVLAAAPSFSATPAVLEFSAAVGSQTVASQRVAVASAVVGLAWSAQVSTQSGGNWLSVSPATGGVPGTLSVTVNLAALAPGTYRGAVTVQSPLAAPPTQSVAVELIVTAATAAQLAVEPASLNFESQVSASPPAQTLRISNSGGGTLNWTARVETAEGGGNWFSITPASGSASAGAPVSAQVRVDSARLDPGVYSGSVIVEAAGEGQSRKVPVTLLVSQVTQTILVSQSGLLFTGVEGGGVVPSQSVGILNIGRGVMNWTARAETLSGGSWLTVSPASGASDAASIRIPVVEIGVSLGSLRAGQYSALVRIESAGANNSPQFVTVDLNVLPPGSNPGPLVRPTGLIFAARAGGTSPGSQTVRVATATPGSVELRSGLLTFDGTTWLESLPRNAVVSPADPRTLTIQPTLGSLAPGVYRAALTLLFADGSPAQTVNVLFVVVAGTGAATHDSSGTQHDCAPERLLAVQRSLGSNFAAAVGWPALIEAQVVDDCGNAVNNATVIASFSSGDPPLPLVALRDGIYTGTWRPVNARPQVAITVRATLAPLARAEVQASAGVGSNPSAPALFSGGVVNGASFAGGGPLSPGSIVSIFGRNLAQGLNHASRLPLEKTLGGATLSVGGVDVPLFFSSPDQVNAQLPFELPPNTRPQMVIKTRREGGPESLAVPETITIASVRPGIFTTNQQGTGQGAILDGQGRLVDSSAPAAAGDVVQIFCTGLGAVLPAVRSGDPAPSAEPLARVTVPVEALVGGRPAVVHFAGLAPGFVGLYQVNIQIPAGVEPGAAVPLLLTQGDVPSNTVTLAIR